MRKIEPDMHIHIALRIKNNFTGKDPKISAVDYIWIFCHKKIDGKNCVK